MLILLPSLFLFDWNKFKTWVFSCKIHLKRLLNSYDESLFSIVIMYWTREVIITLTLVCLIWNMQCRAVDIR